MKSKLYKTHRKPSYYRLRRLGYFSLSLMVATILVVVPLTLAQATSSSNTSSIAAPSSEVSSSSEPETSSTSSSEPQTEPNSSSIVIEDEGNVTISLVVKN